MGLRGLMVQFGQVHLGFSERLALSLRRSARIGCFGNLDNARKKTFLFMDLFPKLGQRQPKCYLQGKNGSVWVTKIDPKIASVTDLPPPKDCPPYFGAGKAFSFHRRGWNRRFPEISSHYIIWRFSYLGWKFLDSEGWNKNLREKDLLWLFSAR